MPYLNVKLCATVSPETSSEIATVLTNLTADVLRKRRELTAVAVEHVDAKSWYIGGARLDQSLRSFFLEIKVTEGTNTKDEKARYVKEAFAAVERIIGPLAPASYIVIHEVHADAWGYQGETQEFRYVKGKAL